MTFDKSSALSRLNEPEPIKIKENQKGEPVAVLGKITKSVQAIEDTWRIDDEWWGREPISRIYYIIQLATGQRFTVYKDLISNLWYRQQY